MHMLTRRTINGEAYIAKARLERPHRRSLISRGVFAVARSSDASEGQEDPLREAPLSRYPRVQSETYGNVVVLDGVIKCTERDEFAYASFPSVQEVAECTIGIKR